MQWSFPWGVTARGARELLVFMNPFPDDATVDVLLATDQGTREPRRLQNLVVRGRSSLGVFIEQDTRRDHVAAQVEVSRGRLVVDRIQTFNGTNPALEGITLGLGAPTPAEVWVFPDGVVDDGITEQIVVFNSTREVAEVDVEVRLDDPDTNGVPEPFELTIAPNRFSIVNLHEPDADATRGRPGADPARGRPHRAGAIAQRGGRDGRAGRDPVGAEQQPRGERHARRPARRPHLVPSRGRRHRRA